MRVEHEAEVAETFGWLVRAEVTRGTSLETLLGRLPPEMARGLREALARLLESEP